MKDDGVTIADVTLMTQRSDMSLRHLTCLALLCFLVIACDPGVFVSSKAHFSNGANVSCVRSAIVAASGQIFDNRGAPEPAEQPALSVEQIEYQGTDLIDPAAQYGYIIQIRRFSDGSTSYSNQWSAIGTHVPPEAEELVRKVDISVQQRCGLPVSKNIPESGPGVVSPD